MSMNNLYNPFLTFSSRFTTLKFMYDGTVFFTAMQDRANAAK
ncbi:Uncharacterised protein [Yersinia frederiksenii]|nr:Uncharacterised protein [Yersinia frederiksenii]